MEKRRYTRPELTVVSFRNERGYELSYTHQLAAFIEIISYESPVYREMESFGNRDGWGPDNVTAFWN